MRHPLDSVVFIDPADAPEELRRALGGFALDSAVPLPVRRDESGAERDGDGGGAEREGSGAEGVTPEMIFAGILTLFAYEPKHERAEYYRRLLTRARPGIIPELSRAALLKAENEDFTLAEEICRAIEGLSPGDPLCALNYAAVLDRREEFCRRSGLREEADALYEDARSWYGKAMAEDFPAAYFNAGAFYFRKHEFDRAKDCFESYIALAQGAGGDGSADEKLERAGECVAYIDARNLDDEAFRNAYRLISSGEETEGVQVIRGFLEKHPHVWNAWFLLGWGLRLAGRYEDGRQAFLQAAEHGGGAQADTWNELALCCMELGKYDECEAFLKKGLARAPENAKIISNIGVLMLKTGRRAEAQRWFRAALEYNPNDAVARASLEA